jgi:predicted SnoaL-like aldol condensation-catalyzing enzyme
MKNTLFITSVLIAAMTCSACNSGKNTDAQVNKIDSLTAELSTVTSKQATEEANKNLVAEFYQQLFGDKDVSAIDKYLLPSYIQHNPSLPDGSEALKKGATQWFAGAPKDTIDIRHLSAEGDLVYIHTRSKMGDKVFSIIDIFRIENGKIAEHWDVLQEVPQKSANDHPMF